MTKLSASADSELFRGRSEFVKPMWSLISNQPNISSSSMSCNYCEQYCAIVHIPGAESQRRNYTSKEPFVRSTQQYDATDREGQSIAIYVILIIEWVLCRIGISSWTYQPQYDKFRACERVMWLFQVRGKGTFHAFIIQPFLQNVSSKVFLCPQVVWWLGGHCCWGSRLAPSDQPVSTSD